MESIKVMNSSSMDRGASQGKSNLVSGSSRFLEVMRWKLIVRIKVGKREIKNPLSCTFNKRELNIISIKRQSIDRVNQKLFDST